MTHYVLGWPAAAVAGYGVVLAALWLLGWRLRCSWLVLAVAGVGVLVYFLALTPDEVFSETRWQRPWGRCPALTAGADDAVQIRNVRDFAYRSEHDYDVRYTDLEIYPSRIDSVDLAVSHWDELEMVAHTMLRFNFTDGREFVVSMETRLPEGVEQGFLPGIYKRYELLMVIGTSRDLLDLRSKYRGETLYIYRTGATREQAALLLTAVLRRLEKLSRKREFYNSVTSNCTTSLAPLLNLIDPGFEGDLRLLLNGFSDKLMFELGYLKHREGESFGSLKSRSYVPGLSSGAAE